MKHDDEMALWQYVTVYTPLIGAYVYQYRWVCI